MIVLVQSSFHTTWASLFEMELEPNSLDWNGNELEHELELEDMKRTTVITQSTNNGRSKSTLQILYNKDNILILFGIFMS